MKKQLFTIATILLIGLSAKAQTYNISTFAGTGASGYTGDGGQATAAKMSGPRSVFEDSHGDFFIDDEGNAVIRKVNTSGIITTVAGNNSQTFSGDGGPATAAGINNPTQIYLDATGNLFISEYDPHVRMVNTNGIINTIAGNGTFGYSGDGGQATAAEFGYPWGVYGDASGNIYIADTYYNRVRMINTSGVISTIAGNGTAGYSGDGGPATAAELNGPYNLFVSASGNLYISDSYSRRVRMVNTNGIISLVAGNGVSGYSGDGGQATAAEFDYPFIAIDDASGNIYTSDVFNYRVRMIDGTGTVNTIAGNGTAGYSGDGGPATAAELAYPEGMCIDALGNILVADAINNCVRILTKVPTGIEEVQKNTLSIYPNPNNGVFQLKITNYELKMNGTVEIYNSLGEKVYSAMPVIRNSQFVINIGIQPSGVYLCRVIAHDGTVIGSSKIIIK